MSFPHGALIAAEQHRRRLQQERFEEEEMANYSKEDLENDWEFKIVRSGIAAFRKPEIFQRLLQEEAISGWEMVEKLDDRRVRFKRRKDARRKEAGLPGGLDPYRAHFEYDSSSFPFVAVILGIILVVGIRIIVSLFSSSASSFVGQALTALIVIGINMVILVGVLAYVFQHR